MTHSVTRNPDDLPEVLQTLEKKKPGTISKVFRTHPLTEDRIERVQKNIQEYLPAKPEYVVNTSEFDQVKAWLMAMAGRRKLDEKEPRLISARTPTFAKSQPVLARRST